MEPNPTVKAVTIKGGAVQDFYKSKGLKKMKGGNTTRKAKKYPRDEDYEDDEQMGGDAPPAPALNMNMKKLGNAMNIVKTGGSPPPGVGANAPGAKASAVEKKGQKGGNFPGIIPQNPAPLTPANEAAKAAGTLTTNLSKGISPSTPSTTPVSNKPIEPVRPEQNPNVPFPEQTGGKKGGKLVLAAKKTKPKLLLAPPSGKKKTRKIRVQLSGMKKRLTRAKHIHKESKEKSIEEIRTILETAKLVKPASSGKKVPEDVLRNIYKDYMLLRGKAL